MNRIDQAMAIDSALYGHPALSSARFGEMLRHKLYAHGVSDAQYAKLNELVAKVTVFGVRFSVPRSANSQPYGSMDKSMGVSRGNDAFVHARRNLIKAMIERDEDSTRGRDEMAIFRDIKEAKMQLQALLEFVGTGQHQAELQIQGYVRAVREQITQRVMAI